MSSFVFNVVKGRMASYLDLVPSNSALVVVPIEFSGLEVQSVLEDKTTLTAVLSGSTNEQTTLGRKTLTSVTTATDNTHNRYTGSLAAQTWTAATGNQLGGVLICYDADTTSGSDSDIIPLTFHEWNVTPSGDDITIYLSNFYVAS